METRHLLLTFDHELFLGRRSGTVERCMERPVDRLLPIIEQYGLRAIFFVDTTFLMELDGRAAVSIKCRADLDRIARQLRELVQRGHAVYPHIHPHWADARYDAAAHQWDLQELRSYRFSALDEAERERVFRGSMEILRRILAPVDPLYRIQAYRAGGWCIQPFDDFAPISRHLVERDMSVLGGNEAA
ncbi:MAG: polysaccharide deacetylase family protein [Flavobacteriales bacterium]|nr:polysaccharide deacetylase family protein [Flavobacteriales bacterium]